MKRKNKCFGLLWSRTYVNTRGDNYCGYYFYRITFLWWTWTWRKTEKIANAFVNDKATKEEG
jgi:hypothetical protein